MFVCAPVWKRKLNIWRHRIRAPKPDNHKNPDWRKAVLGMLMWRCGVLFYRYKCVHVIYIERRNKRTLYGEPYSFPLAAKANFMFDRLGTSGSTTSPQTPTHAPIPAQNPQHQYTSRHITWRIFNLETAKTIPNLTSITLINHAAGNLVVIKKVKLLCSLSM